MTPYYYLKFQLFEWLEQRQVAKHFYTNPSYRNLDQTLLSNYKDLSAYTLSKSYHEARQDKEIHVYGETPLTTLAQIAKTFRITSSDTLIEMGAGRGRGALFFAEYIGCNVIAYEQNPAFVSRAVQTPRLHLQKGDMFTIDLTPATVIYLYGTLLTETEITQLIKRFPPHAKIVTVSYPLSDYDPSYRTHKTLEGRFPWGKTDIYWNICNRHVRAAEN